MGRIHLLEDDVINKIAAGEVVERPASVVKELVENALDAGATEIDLALELGGIRSIVVTDNGSGMARDDAVLALKRHATSKISSADDLFKISTMGFRGEAMASIAAVSCFTLATATGREETGAGGVKLVQAEGGGGELTVLPWHGPKGTTISVERLFYNMPVRAKFLKAPTTEFSHCLELVHAFALAYPHVGFTLRHNGREQLRLAALPERSEPGYGELVLQERGKAVLGKDGPALLYVQTSSRYGELEVLLSPPGVEKGTAKSIFTFANGRLVKDKVLRYGILRGYHSHIMKGRFPIVLLHLRCDPALIDVNVHPSKTEVRFQYADEVQSLIALGIRNALRGASWAAPSEAQDPGTAAGGNQAPRRDDSGVTLAANTPGFFSPPLTPAPLPQVAGAVSALPKRPFNAETSSFPGSSFLRRPSPYREGRAAVVSSPRPAQTVTNVRSYDSFQASAPEPQAPGRQLPASVPVFDKAGIDALVAAAVPNLRDGFELATQPTALAKSSAINWNELSYIGAFDRCYLLFAQRGQLLVVDQHAFHERILFERLVADQSLLSQSQRLLVPESIELSPSEVAVLSEQQAVLAARGFTFAAESATTLVVSSVPTLLAARDLAALFAELAQNFTADFSLEPAATNAELARLILATAACHAAVRAGEELPDVELRQLLAEARQVDFTHNCPHGRRVFKWWSTAQVSHWFDR